MPPAVTVLMPVHNGLPYVRAAAESILSQTLRDIELLVVDDASTDATVECLEALNDPRIRILQCPERVRFSGALNRGLAEVRGSFVARMDADDLAMPDRLAIQKDYLDAHPDVGLCGGLATTFGTRSGPMFRPPLSHAEVGSYVTYDCPFVHPTVMWRRRTFEAHGLRFDPAYCPSDDYELWSRCVRLFRTVNLPRVVLRYRVHPASLTSAEWGEMDTHATRVAARELAALGLQPNADEIAFHRRLGRGRSFPIKSMDVLESAERWLRRLVAANRESGHNPDDAFRRVTAGVWFSACYHAGAVGGRMLRCYAASELRRGRTTTAHEWAALLRAAVLRLSS